jgi:hypothetical protein
MTKLIGILIIVLAIWGGYELFEYWSNYDTDKDLQAKAAEEARNFTPQQLPGMPWSLEDSYAKAQAGGAVGIKNWLKAYSAQIQDPRLAWIELDYAVLVAQKDPAEAKRVFEDVKARIPQDSKIYPRIKQLEKTYE